MSKEQQIEEMAKVIDAMEGGNAYIECFDNAFADADKIAEVLYNAGYRKRNEGRWIFKGTAYGCSLCGEGVIAPIDKHCRNCGARMKGGAE